ncbi:MAG: ABC transporter permease [Planctomycetota bacterium]|jgi:peptide/nickel transport system permease protein
MATYILRRLLQVIPVLLGVLLIAFAAVRLTPGGPALAVLGEKATQAKIDQVNKENGWDKPIPVQFVTYVGQLCTGDLGRSFHTKRPILDDLKQKVPATIELALAAMLLAILLGIPAGILSSLKPGKPVDAATMSGALLGVSFPVFFLGMVLIISFPAMPAGGRLPVTVDIDPITGLHLIDSLLQGDWSAFGAALRHLLLPALTLATVPLAVIARMTRSSLLEVLHDDYIRTARAKGLGGRAVVLRHALRNAAVPIVTVIGLNVGYLLAGAVLTETVFSWPGLGRYVVEAVKAADYNAVQAGLLVTAVSFVSMNLLVDIAYAWIDPRIRVADA